MSDYPGDIYNIANQFKQDLLNLERAAAVEIAQYYGGIWSELNRRIQDLIAQYELSGGAELPAEWVLQFERLASLKRQVEAELLRFVEYTEQVIIKNQEIVTALATGNAAAMVESAGVDLVFNRLPNEALRDLIGFLQDGSPLRTLLDGLPLLGGQAVADGLVQGLALGLNPRVVARNIRAAMGMALTRALVIARTETLRSYREATKRNYENNSDILSGWVWLSAADERTCGSCWAMHGSFHSLDERLDDHPNGRCSMVPAVKGAYTPLKPGPEAFEDLPEEKKLAILGPAKYAAYSAGDLTLEDLVGQKHSREWGSMRYERSLKELGIDWKDYQIEE